MFGYISKHRQLSVGRRRTEAKVQLSRGDRTPCIVDAGEGLFLNPEAHRIAFLTAQSAHSALTIKDAQRTVRRNLNRVDDFEVELRDPGLGEGFVVVEETKADDASISSSTSSESPTRLVPHAVVFSNEHDEDPDVIELDPAETIADVYKTHRSNDLTLYLWMVMEERITHE